MGHHQHDLYLHTYLDRIQDLYVELGSDQFQFLRRAAE